MEEETPLSKDELFRQLAGHVQSLQRAGVEWLPSASRRAGEVLRTPRVEPPPIIATAAEVSPPPAEPALAIEERRLALKVLAAEVAKCTRCPDLCSTRKQTVFGQGRPDVELCFIGEAPGADEDAQGLPFVGKAGELLTKIIEGCGLKRDEVYICNILKCRPPNNRTPLPNEAANCREYLERQLGLIRPKFICALGGCAASNLLGTNVPLGKLRGKFHDFKGIPVLVTYHPAYLLPHRNPDKKRDVWEDMKMLLTRMGRPIPQKK